MKPATLKALKGSIRKWELIVAGTGADDGQHNCPLCQRFDRYELALCETDNEQCPVAIATGDTECSGSPYVDWRRAITETRGIGYFRHDKATDDETVMCAVLELEFLRDLLPKGVK